MTWLVLKHGKRTQKFCLKTINFLFFVIPAKAGIQTNFEIERLFKGEFTTFCCQYCTVFKRFMDPRLRGDDNLGEKFSVCNMRKELVS